ncbi:MAG: homoserine dehydrogenase [Candidatus Omnitrophica bacterium]|nr:homoserine dehydrogenase [Candidatus Omnitrophota bacterium]
MKKIQIGMIGLGTVGTGVAKVLQERAALLEEKTGTRLFLKKVCVQHPDRKRELSFPKGILTRNVHHVLDDPEIQIVLELIGGIHPAKEYIMEALRRGKHVVTANKALLAEEGRDIFRLAEQKKRRVQFEASVGGGIPIIKSLKEGLVSNRIQAILGIINGTSNFILTRMTETGCTFGEALKEAQKRGYAERNPSLDIDGVDSAHKLVILALLGFGQEVPLDRISIEGIRHVSPKDTQYAGELGYRVKLLAIAKQTSQGLELRVQPTLIPKGHPLAFVNGAYNAITVRGDLVGETIFYGEGAGRLPTSSAVLSDLLDLAQRIQERDSPAPPLHFKSGVKRIKPMASLSTRYYFRFSVVDRPGVLSQISRLLGRHRISIASVIQKETHQRRSVPLIMVTHEALERDVHRAIQKIDRLGVVKARSIFLRIEEV